MILADNATLRPILSVNLNTIPIFDVVQILSFSSFLYSVK